MPYKDKEKRRECARINANKRYKDDEYRARRREYIRQWRLKNYERETAKWKAYHEKYRERHNELNILRRRKIKAEILTHYGNGKLACVKCGFDDIRALTIDHINGGGNKQKREAGGITGTQMYYWLKAHNYPDGFQTLCHNCQWIKRDERHEYYNYLG